MGTETDIATVGQIIMVDSLVECMDAIKIIEGKQEWVRYEDNCHTETLCIFTQLSACWTCMAIIMKA